MPAQQGTAQQPVLSALLEEYNRTNNVTKTKPSTTCLPEQHKLPHKLPKTAHLGDACATHATDCKHKDTDTNTPS
jgi:hypothetical protein